MTLGLFQALLIFELGYACSQLGADGIVPDELPRAGSYPSFSKSLVVPALPARHDTRSPSARRGRSPPTTGLPDRPPNRRKPKCTRCARACSWRGGPVTPGHRSTTTRRKDEMPRNQNDSKDVDNGNSDQGRKSRGPALNRVLLVGRLA